MDVNSEQTLRNLHVLGALSHNDKLMTNEDTFDIYSPTSLRGVLRMWYRENRMHNIDRVRVTIKRAIQYVERTLEEATTSSTTSHAASWQTTTIMVRLGTVIEHHIRMMNALNRARYGLWNLMQTYREDAAVASQINLIVEETNSFLTLMNPHTLHLQKMLQSTQSASSAPGPLHSLALECSSETWGGPPGSPPSACLQARFPSSADGI